MALLVTDADRPSRLLHFVLAAEPLAVDIRWLRGVVVIEDYTRVPSGPPQLLGLANLRGRALPLLDAGPALGFAARAPGGRMLVLVVAAGEAQAGIVIDTVLGLEDPGVVVPFGEGTPGPHLELGLGLVRRGDGVALLLDTAKLLHALRINTRWTVQINARGAV